MEEMQKFKIEELKAGILLYIRNGNKEGFTETLDALKIISPNFLIDFKLVCENFI